MADRRSFLGAVSGIAATVLLARDADAQTAPAAPVSPAIALPASASPAPAPSASPKPASPQAAAIAASMRRFDSALSDADVATIAQGIDANRAGAARLNPRKATALKNGDEPVTRFAVARPR